MEEDFEGTVAAWQDALENVIKPRVADHSGKIVKLTGDGFLVEFPTLQDAVNCAIAMQDGLAASSLDFRIGVNLGEIIDDGEDLHDDGYVIKSAIIGEEEFEKAGASSATRLRQLDTKHRDYLAYHQEHILLK